MIKIKEKLGKVWLSIKGLWNKFGVFLIVAIVIWLSPSWLSFFIPALKPFALTWLALVVSPAVPSWAAIPLLAIISKLVFVGIKRLVIWVKDQLTKLKYGAEIFTLYTVDEIELILKNGHKMKKIKDDETRIFKKQQRDKRIRLIKENWEQRNEHKK